MDLQTINKNINNQMLIYFGGIKNVASRACLTFSLNVLVASHAYLKVSMAATVYERPYQLPQGGGGGVGGAITCFPEGGSDTIGE